MAVPDLTASPSSGSPPASYARHAISAPAASALDDSEPDNILADLYEVPIVGRQYFQDYILPKLPCNKRVLKKVVARLVANGTIVDGRWKYWPKDPRGVDATALGGPEGRLMEDKAFQGLDKLADEVQTAFAAVGGRPAQDALVTLRCNRACVPVSISRNEVSKSKPDIYWLNKDFTSPLRWCDIVTPGELKTMDDSAEKLDNYKKILRSMAYIMQEDARRRFVIGFTIENVSMRLWFLSRSEVLATAEFNFMTNHHALVDFLLRMSFANASQLGFDETMIRLPELSPFDKSVVYEIQVWDDSVAGSAVKKYRTRRLLSELHAERPRGRGTRVWEVEELGDDGRPTLAPKKVMKDTWGDIDRRLEGSIVKNIEEDAEKAGKRKAFMKHFVPIERYGRVHVTEGKQSRPDSTNCFRLNRRRAKAIPKTVNTLQIAARPTFRMPFLNQKLLSDASRYPAKVHHRTVYSQVGEPLLEAPSLHEAIKCLGQAVQGVGFMHELGWVHRDISYGNILIIAGSGKIVDLEYAQKASDAPNPRDIWIGTPLFMSHEVQDQAYHHIRPTPATFAKARAHAYDFDFDEFKSPPPMPPLREKAVRAEEVIPFRYNPLHDLESLVLVCLFLFLAPNFKRNPHDVSRCLPGFKQAQDEAFNTIFLRRDSRLRLFRGGRDIIELTLGIHPTLSDAVTYLQPVCNFLRRDYEAAEAAMTPSNPIPFTTWSRAAKYLARHLYRMLTDVLTTDDPLPLLNKANLRPRGPMYQAAPTLPNKVTQASVQDVDPADRPKTRNELVETPAATSDSTAGPGRNRENTAASSDPPPRPQRTPTKNIVFGQLVDAPTRVQARHTSPNDQEAIACGVGCPDGAGFGEKQFPAQESGHAAGPSSSTTDTRSKARKQATPSTARPRAAKGKPTNF
ncbi:hypothetical protein PsYK624_112400 [Phanerochaete sordida]|uniref:Fungal-type protein kinase domain-containing protein n=1 Tax=Phanerochaete sordida TaxID=48140 RepID=A0A9P3GHJ8_9APHY|nr:hypothetical protein PsYK624_112400 [Phanerochaete sordida]